jgi:uncharacterized membrane protein YcaP (DUF421 family)
MWFDTSWDVVRVLVVGTVGYVALVLSLRISGKRTLAKLNAFDLVVTVALGSVLATLALSSDVSLSEGAAGLGILIVLQFAVAFLSSRLHPARVAVKAQPSAVVLEGEVLVDELRRQRLTTEEVDQALRQAGLGGIELAAAVVLETDGSLTVIPREQRGSGSALADFTR